MTEESNEATSFSAMVIDGDVVHVLANLSFPDALGLVGCAGEDPATWDDLTLIWARYRFDPANVEFLNSLPVQTMDWKDAGDVFCEDPAWLALDLRQRRVFTGTDFFDLRLRYAPSDENGVESYSVILPPWWELHQHVSPTAIRDERQSPIGPCVSRRDVLWGKSMTQFFADRMLRVVREGTEWLETNPRGEPCGKYALTVEIHREWLMTARDDLSGGIPRESLHVAKDWIGSLVELQMMRANRDEEFTATPMELSNFETASMGLHEVVMYFDACREVINAGWDWLIENRSRIDDSDAQWRLSNVMDQFLAEWFVSPHEGGPSPEEIIRCERSRIPLVASGDSHILDCNCPLCEMIASGDMGPSMYFLDGSSMEIDQEFAFSTYDDFDEWEAEQAEWAEMDSEFEDDENSDFESEEEDEEDDDDDDDDDDEDEEEEVEDDLFQSVWGGSGLTEGEIPGDTSGHWGTAFHLAEMIGWLQFNKGEQADIVCINASFRDYRTASGPFESAAAGESFKDALEDLAEKYPGLESRAADLQSRIDMQLRAMANE